MSNGGARPLLLVLGTGTEVGKTWVGVSIVERCRAWGWHVQARKPAQSFDPTSGDPTDAELLAGATGEDPATVCTLSYPIPMAPPMAAEALGLAPVTLSDLVGLVTWNAPTSTDSSGSPDSTGSPDSPDSTGSSGAAGSSGSVGLRLVEAAGGVRSPQAVDGDCVDLARALHPDAMLLVAHAGLGTISAVRHGVRALAGFEPVVLLNFYDRADELHRRNARWLADRDGFRIATSVEEALSLLALGT